MGGPLIYMVWGGTIAFACHWPGQEQGCIAKCVQLDILELYLVRGSKRRIYDHVESDGFIRIRSVLHIKVE